MTETVNCTGFPTRSGRLLRRRFIWSLGILIYALVHITLQESPPDTKIKSVSATSTSTSSEGIVYYRQRRQNCTPPAIEQFPRPSMGPWWRKHGGLIFHILICVYSFIGLAIVCDEYFVTSLDRICEEFKLSPDVAGATFMAAGSSAPELATVVIGVFFAKDDIGVSGVIGSAVFNIMFVISICAMFAGTVSYLNWWPLCRDCFFYALSILIMLCVIFDEKISWKESLFMLITYVGYCVALAYNKSLEEWARQLPIPCRDLNQVTAEQEDQHLVTYRHLDDKQQAGGGDKVLDFGSTGGTNQVTSPGQQQPPPVPPPPQPKPDYYKAKEPDANQINPLIKPENADMSTTIQWGICVPVHYMCQKTMPDCRTEQYRNWYPFTFVISMIWISFYSYIMVWMITVIGHTLGIPDTVMGLTFVAAGVSVPDALSSLAVVKEGYGDMAVSNAVGSNVFDILICLGLPWFIQTALIRPGSHVNVYSKGLTYSTLSLLSTVIFLVMATHMNGWKLDKKYGTILMLWYLFFIGFASLYELNVFGYMNPPECVSDY
ncbi:probable sodium/potassium/calcium exchanger CG1090 isoform X1 [Nilaparvata lugens]|uniref:probable sodium/potassium/calcium exchanger CG1090 isoform X1 n=1 Tax=Nilaparvata lugens TaxID=108931 RepID=UPI00193DB049|nr:probable sodium/potassium/calcium exchanger CG1090 isoform X1 [Nilaparvata lugens]XP_039291096.1 probable sodium/potassium/calcium exchanger CG1090 isoform X2 [Nilaparvata lugens]XP_039291103.1 probable sodium/potassium/calcium exchanger CG1090 isoform X1 [Nilaparvata lugens]